MIVPELEASQYLGRASSGRNHPPIVECTVENDLFEFYVKLRNGAETSKASLIFELLAVQIANELGVATADPALVKVTSEFSESIEDEEVRVLFRRNIGLNFGCKRLGEQYAILPNTSNLSGPEIDRATEIFAFDALVQNADRSPRTPNILVKGTDWRVIDHELAFSFTRDIGLGTDEALGNLMRTHVFFRILKGKAVDLSRFEQRLVAMLHSGAVYEWISDLPIQWTSGEEHILEKVSRHFESISKKPQQFIRLIKQIIQ